MTMGNNVYVGLIIEEGSQAYCGRVQTPRGGVRIVM